MLKNGERFQKILAADDIATQGLSSKDREFLIRFDEELDRLRKEKEVPDSCSEPEEMINEAFRLVPGAERALDRQIERLDTILKTGSGESSAK